MGYRLKWADNNLAEDGYRIYRGEAPLDTEDLPVPLATLGPDTTQYDDTTALDDVEYFYRVSAFAGTQEAVSTEVNTTDALGDPHWDNVVILLPIDGDISDAAGMPWGMRGGAEVVPSSESFTGTELHLASAASSYILTGNNETLHLPYGTPWVFEGFHTPLEGGGQEILMSKRDTSSGWEFRCDQGENYVVVAAGNDWGAPIEYFPASDVTGRRFFQFKMDEDGTCGIYLNGLLHKQYPPESTKPFLTNYRGVTVGSSPNGPSPRYLNGLLGQLRFTVGASRPTVPPAATFPSAGPALFPPMELEVINPRAATNVSGWTATTGTLTRKVVGDSNAVRSVFTSTRTVFAHQDIGIGPETLYFVDSSQAMVRVQYQFGGWSGDNDSGEVGFTFLDENGSQLGTVWSGLERYPRDWPTVFRRFTADIPPLTRKIRLAMHGVWTSGADMNAVWTDFKMFVDPRPE